MQQIAQGEIQVVVGARSAIFAPTPQLGLIIIDEEHETTFKQQTTPRYHAREVARERARMANIPLILGSATPTLESVLDAKRKDSIYLPLSKRAAGRPMPPVALVDTRNDPQIAKGEAIGRAMQNAVRGAIDAGGQVILFLNLRGYSPVVWCVRCAKALECPHCTLSLTWHKDRGTLMCHSCEYEVAKPATCLACGMPGLRFLGTGTQRLESEVASKFGGVKTLRMDSDAMKKAGSHDIALEAFRKGEYRLLLGTQMIAKGLDFPNVTLVGVIDADTLLHQPDLRATERTFQLIAQVAGRTGRGEQGGRVLVQTACPDERVIQLAAAHDFNSFSRRELANREALKAPPFVHFARVIFRGPEEELVKNEARRVGALMQREMANLVPPSSSVPPPRIIGPAPAPVLMLKKYYRYHLQLAHADVTVLHQLWRAVLPHLDLHASVELTIDVDPLDMR